MPHRGKPRCILLRINILINTFSSFLGAFFAFLFFIKGEKWKRKIDKKEKIKKEHALLERYLYNLLFTIKTNKKVLEIIIQSYKKKEIEMSKLADLPIHKNSSMKVKDQLFINRLEIYIDNGLKKINRWQNSINSVQDKLNEDLLSNNNNRRQRAENSLKVFIIDTEQMIKTYNYYLETIEDLILENRILLKKYKTWNYEKNKMQKLYNLGSRI